MTRSALGGALALMLLAGSLACNRPPTLPAGFTAAESAAFQRAHDELVGAPAGPLAAVGSHYVAEGHTLALGIVEGALVVDPPGDGERVRVSMSDGVARCLEGCGDTPVAIDESTEVSLDRFTLTLSPQSDTVRVVVLDPKAPARVAYSGLSWFPIDPALIVAARFEPDPARPQVELSTSRGLQKKLVRAGTLRAQLGEQAIELSAFSMGEGPLLVPLTDATSGEQTYPVGRYLEVEAPADGVAVLDFNRLTNPWCAYSDHYNCPIPPRDNTVAVALVAGERYQATHEE